MRRRRAKLVCCLTCGYTLRHRAQGRCDACYMWHQRHGWNVARTWHTDCADCGVSCRTVPHRSLGRCDACYRRQWRQGRAAI